MRIRGASATAAVSNEDGKDHLLLAASICHHQAGFCKASHSVTRPDNLTLPTSKDALQRCIESQSGNASDGLSIGVDDGEVVRELVSVKPLEVRARAWPEI